MAGCVISCESTCPVAFGQFSSNCPRLTAVCIAVGCLLARNWAWLVQPVKTSKLMSATIINDFDIHDLLSLRDLPTVNALVMTLYRSAALLYWTLVQYGNGLHTQHSSTFSLITRF